MDQKRRIFHFNLFFSFLSYRNLKLQQVSHTIRASVRRVKPCLSSLMGVRGPGVGQPLIPGLTVRSPAPPVSVLTRWARPVPSPSGGILCE